GVTHRGRPRSGLVRRRLLHVLRGHRPVLAAAGPGLDDPLPAGRRAAAHPLRVQQGVVAALGVPRGPQPAADADQERVHPGGAGRGAALPGDRGLDAGPGAARGGRPAPPPGPAAAPAAGPDHAVLPAAAARDAAAPPGGRPEGHRLPAGTRTLAGAEPMTAPANGRRGAAPRSEATAGGPPRPEDRGEPGTEQLSASRGVAGVERVPRAAVYNRFWHSMGGGERHSGMIA